MAIRIEQVDAGSEAEALGLAPGDELLLSLIHIYALVLIDGGTAALPSDGLLGAHLHTGVCKAALTQVRDCLLYTSSMTSVAISTAVWKPKVTSVP